MPALLLCLPQKPSQAQVGLTSVPSSAWHKVSALSGVWMEPGCPGLTRPHGAAGDPASAPPGVHHPPPPLGGTTKPSRLQPAHFARQLRPRTGSSHSVLDPKMYFY